MEEEIERIVEKRLREIEEKGYALKSALKLATIDAYRAGMEAVRKVRRS